MKVSAEWKKKMKFVATSGTKHQISMDTSEQHGGEDTAARPKELLLMGLCGCTGMDVVSILKKMRQDPDSFRMEVEADTAEEHPMIFNRIHLKYIFHGNLEKEKIERAVELSQTKYCSVSEILRKSSTLTYEIIYE